MTQDGKPRLPQKMRPSAAVGAAILAFTASLGLFGLGAPGFGRMQILAALVGLCLALVGVCPGA